MAYSRSGIFSQTILKETYVAKQWQKCFNEDKSEQQEERALIFKSLYFAFGFWSIGLIISLAGFIYELGIFVRAKNGSYVEKCFQTRKRKVGALKSKHMYPYDLTVIDYGIKF